MNTSRRSLFRGALAGLLGIGVADKLKAAPAAVETPAILPPTPDDNVAYAACKVWSISVTSAGEGYCSPPMVSIAHPR